MEHQQLIALFTFAFVTIITPGPNNIMLMTSGANVGFMKTLPHMLGVTVGFSAMVTLIGIGLVGIFHAYPWLHNVLQAVSIMYLLYLSYAIATSRAPTERGDDQYRPLTFWMAASFQWVNPKGWSMALSTVTLYNPEGNWHGIVIIALVFALVNLPSTGIWTLAGQKLQQVLTHPTRLRMFNYAMAGLLLVSIVPVFVL
ncbi:LysE family translocator [Photobacterium japonica]|uniref:LysE family translocator n=1 Tax=Photobacterium japonica TaxID=2910235 RepID=UPI003D136565